MNFKDSGKLKAITFSFDDGVLQDIRMIELLDKYGLKATFNLNSGLFGGRNILRFERERAHVVHRYIIAREDVKDIYAGHEVAGHTLTHANLTTLEDDDEIIRQVEQDRLNLSEIVGYEVLGMAYAGGGVNSNAHCAELIRKHTGIRYGRGLKPSHSFDFPQDLYRFAPSASTDHLDILNETTDRFIQLRPDKPQLFYIMGHTYCMDYENDYWMRLEAIFEKLSGLDDVFYSTNKEILL